MTGPLTGLRLGRPVRHQPAVFRGDRRDAHPDPRERLETADRVLPPTRAALRGALRLLDDAPPAEHS